jgi:hypothetical protein
MANLDTRAKRESGMHPAMPWRSPMKVISGAFSQADRQACAFMYSGILASAGGGNVFISMERATFMRVFGRIFGRVN